MRWPSFLGALLIVLAVLRICLAYSHNNHTNDEPAHIGNGMKFLQGVPFHDDVEHPPLVPLLVALPMHLSGLKATTELESVLGAHLLFKDLRYWERLTNARLMLLPLFFLSCLFVWIWGVILGGEILALIAVFLYSTNPTVLAHAMLATTDLTITCMYLFSTLTMYWWIKKPCIGRSVALGFGFALAILSKYSALVFLPGTAFVFMIFFLPSLKKPSEKWFPNLSIVLVSLVFFVSVGFRFRFGDLFHSIYSVFRHHEVGSVNYFMGELSESGHFWYFPIVLLLKTPIPSLIFWAVGAASILFKKSSVEIRALFTSSILLLGICLFSNLSGGLRHILPLFPFFCLTAAHGTEFLHTKKWQRVILGILFAWQAGTSLPDHPDYISYANAFAGPEPDKYFVDSDYDWGQSWAKAAHWISELKVSPLYILCSGTHVPVLDYFAPAKFLLLKPCEKVRGYLMVSSGGLRFLATCRPELLKMQPISKLGKTLRLYHLE